MLKAIGLSAILLCFSLTGCARPLHLYLGVHHKDADPERVVCDNGLQATFTLPDYRNGTTVTSPLVSLDEGFWSSRLNNFGTSEPIAVTIEAYCYRAGQTTGYIKASGVTRASSPDRSPTIIEVSSPPAEQTSECSEDGVTLLESTEPTPCVTFTFLF